MEQVGKKALVKASSAFIPPSLLDTVPGAGVGAVMVLQPGAYHLVWVRDGRRQQLGQSRKRQVLHRPHFSVDGEVAGLVVPVLHLLVSHEL